MQSEWLEYYTNLGINLVIWNYRGYGRSKQGCKLLRIQNIQKDGEYVYQYVKSNLVRGKIGIHGESMGGSIASYIAMKCDLNFAFIDRTFSSISHIAFWGLKFKAAARLFNCLTLGWHDNGLRNFKSISNQTYTLFGADPEDTIIMD